MEGLNRKEITKGLRRDLCIVDWKCKGSDALERVANFRLWC